MPIPTRLANDGWWLCGDIPLSHANASQNQMTSISLTALPPPALLRGVPRKLAVAIAATAFADWLFYDHAIGLSLALFLLVLACISLLANPVRTSRRQVLIAVAILIAGLAPIMEELDTLSALFGVVAVAVAVASLTNPFIEGLRDRVKAVLALLLAGPFRLFPDLARSLSRPSSLSHLTMWIVPLFLSGIFLLLFASANPLIEHMLATLDLWKRASEFSVARPLFWIVTLSAIWPFVHVRWHRKAVSQPPVAIAQQDAAPALPANLDTLPDEGELFGPGTILRSLISFNLLFAVQSVMDLTYLWGGIALPDGMTYATYAHRGAYPLMLTALLAAGFVLVAIAPGGPAERKPAIRALVFVWIAQNVMLVVSSLLRLDLYVETYSLTYWRVAALIWMVLVAVGLMLIVARIALNRPNRWLVLANLTTLALVLYACAFINFPWAISTYNVAHGPEISGNGASVDFLYLLSLGPQALPAIDRYLDLQRRSPDVWKPSTDWTRQVDCLVNRHHTELASWRTWNFRGWRLQRYLDRDRIAANSTALP
jgi:uncharacterized protein DUF4153